MKVIFEAKYQGTPTDPKKGAPSKILRKKEKVFWPVPISEGERIVWKGEWLLTLGRFLG